VTTLSKNELAHCQIALAEPVVVDPFQTHRTLGEVLFIDRVTNATSACGIVEAVQNASSQETQTVTPARRARQKGQDPTLVLTGNLEEARSVEDRLVRYGRHTMTLETADHAGFAAQLLLEAGLMVLAPKNLLTEAELKSLAETVKVTDLTASGTLEDLVYTGEFI
jgi:hypothetical protein